MARPRAACGTYAAYRRHLREKSPVDDACRAAARAEKARRADVEAAERSSNSPERSGATVTNIATSSGNDSPPQIDVQAELHANLALVKAAMAVVGLSDPSKLPALSKRHSELLQELERAGATSESEDPFDAFFAGDNVVGFTASTDRKSS